MVCVHDGDERRGSGHYSLDAGGRKPAPAESVKAPHARIVMCDLSNEGRRTIWRMIVNENNLPTDIGQGFVDCLY